MISPTFVSSQWLNQHQSDPNVQVIDARLLPPGLEGVRDIHAEYHQQHLPNAVYFDIEALSCKQSPYPHMLAQPEFFAQAMRELGIDSDKHLVVYDEGSLFSAPRAAFMLLLYGAKQVSILSGGMQAWRLAGNKFASGPVTLPSAKFNLQFNDAPIINLSQMSAISKAQNATIIDARPAARYLAQVDEPRPGLKRGHIPASVNLPWQSLVEEGRLLTNEKLIEAFKTAKIPLTEPFVVYCGSGVTAILVWLAIKHLGYQDVSVYDGSWGEWGSLEELPVTLPSQPSEQQ